MIRCSLQNTADFTTAWIQKRPYITQLFGKNPQIYSQFKMKGHNGIDYRAAVGTPVFAPMSGHVQVKNSGGSGYGLHIKMRNPFRLLEVVLGHLSSTGLRTGQIINSGDFLGFSGNTGFSTGPHVHEGLRRILEGGNDIFTWAVEDHDNGYYGYFDHYELTTTWKGTLAKNTVEI